MISACQRLLNNDAPKHSFPAPHVNMWWGSELHTSLSWSDSMELRCCRVSGHHHQCCKKPLHYLRQSTVRCQHRFKPQHYHWLPIRFHWGWLADMTFAHNGLKRCQWALHSDVSLLKVDKPWLMCEMNHARYDGIEPAPPYPKMSRLTTIPQRHTNVYQLTVNTYSSFACQVIRELGMDQSHNYNNVVHGRS